MMNARLEARVGIGRLMPCFQGKNTLLSEQTQYNLALSDLTKFNTLTEDFTEGFVGQVVARTRLDGSGIFWEISLDVITPYSIQ